ncbi:hypothetical protein E1292_17190 [Nonomuraea deserti]|uniref:Bacterial transcriptional activator domain-containing protein n=1 Tax=Nonomuraea deserti TaxID=1848322 RepID=A0A4R4VY18_9ACTN|nr:hypothetical protein E1292_17190 [Nonomuraea deserti]
MAWRTRRGHAAGERGARPCRRGEGAAYAGAPRPRGGEDRPRPPQEAIDDICRLLAEEQLRERAWYLLILALARTGRRDKALDAYQRARHALVAELGVEPGADLRRLQAMILDGKLQPVALGSPRGGICQLPLDIADFVGRREELAAAAGTLCREHGRAEAAPPARKPPTPTVPVCVVSGQGGRRGDGCGCQHAQADAQRDQRTPQVDLLSGGARPCRRTARS